MADKNTSDNDTPVTFRTHRPGDMGYIVYRHAIIYTRDHGFIDTFEAFIARILATFLESYDPARERCWIAERDGQFLGCIFLIADPDQANTARIRVLLVEPSARGLGIGRQLVQRCLDFARATGYGQVILFTQSVLGSARRLYEAFGFGLVEELPLESYAPGSVGQLWRLGLGEQGVGQ